MDFKEYQARAEETAIYPNVGKNLMYAILGLLGEGGEIANKVKKIFRDDDGELSEEKKEALKGELGDVLWYLALVSMELGFDLDEVAEYNLKKLSKRKEQGTLHGSGDKRSLSFKESQRRL